MKKGTHVYLISNQPDDSGNVIPAGTELIVGYSDLFGYSTVYPVGDPDNSFIIGESEIRPVGGVVQVMNLATRQIITYTCTPRMAVICAYAQERKDFNSWDYEKRYGSMVEKGQYTFLIGDWSVFIDGRRVER
jgi:hypothetical protein